MQRGCRGTLLDPRIPRACFFSVRTCCSVSLVESSWRHVGLHFNIFQAKEYCPTILSNNCLTSWLPVLQLHFESQDPPYCQLEGVNSTQTATWPALLLGSFFFFYCFEAKLSRGFWKVHLRSMLDKILFLSPTKNRLVWRTIYWVTASALTISSMVGCCHFLLLAWANCIVCLY